MFNRRDSDNCCAALWTTGACDRRALFAQFCAIQHYISGRHGLFERAAEDSLELFAAAGRRGNRVKRLVEVLQANELHRLGRFDEAAAAYERMADAEASRNKHLVRGRANNVDPRIAIQQRVVVALLYHNCAECLRAADADPVRVDAAFASAVEYAPDLPMIWNTIAEWSLARKRWGDAKSAFRCAFVARGIGGNAAMLNADLARVYLEQAIAARGAGAEPGTKDAAPQTASSASSGDASRPSPAALWRVAVRGLRSRLALGLARRRKRPQRPLLPPEDGPSVVETPGGVAARAASPSGASLALAGSTGDSSAERDAASTSPDVNLRAALAVLEQANESLDWTGNPGWQGRLHFERGAVLRELGRQLDATDAFRRAAACYLEAKRTRDTADPAASAAESKADARGAADSWLNAGDCLAESHLLDDATASYQNAGSALSDAGDDSIAARTAVAAIIRSQPDGARYELECIRTRYAVAGASSDWGPYFDTLQTAQALISPSDWRHRVTLYYQRLLEKSQDPVVDRDLTAAIMDLYGRERRHLASRPGTAADRSTTRDLLNVVTPIALEVSVAFAQRAGLNDDVIKEHAQPMRERLQERFGVLIPGVRVRSTPELEDGGFTLLIHEVTLVRGRHGVGGLAEMFSRLESLVVENLAEFFGHQEAQNYLERNALVRPTVADVAEKENVDHMTPFTKVVRALLVERVPLTDTVNVYGVFRSGWLRHAPLEDIAEAIRKLPANRAALWGNGEQYERLLVPPSFEDWIDAHTRVQGGCRVLVSPAGERGLAVHALSASLEGHQAPALVVRVGSHRALVRQLIRDSLPEVPVLSIDELPITASAPIELMEQGRLEPTAWQTWTA